MHQRPDACLENEMQRFLDQTWWLLFMLWLCSRRLSTLVHGASQISLNFSICTFLREIASWTDISDISADLRGISC